MPNHLIQDLEGLRIEAVPEVKPAEELIEILLQIESAHLMMRTSCPVLAVNDQPMDFRHCISFFRRNWKMNTRPPSLTIRPPFIGYNHRIGIHHLIHSLGNFFATEVRNRLGLGSNHPGSSDLAHFRPQLNSDLYILSPSLGTTPAPGSNPPITVSSASTSPASDSTSKADMACWTFRLKNHAVS